MFHPFAQWLSTTSLSVSLQEHSWIIPTSQSIHIVCVCLLFTSALAINARLLRARMPGRTISDLTNTLLPVMRWALAGLAFTGILQTIAEPVRQFVTPVFWAKMLMIVIVAIMTVAFARQVRARSAQWDDLNRRPQGAKAFAIITSLLWTCIVICGRFIGYTSSFYT